MAKTPEEIWASMNADQQKAFQTKNKDFSVDMVKSPVNQQNASGTFSPIAPKTTTTAPTQTSTYNPNVFGDVSGKSTAGQNLSGIKTSTGTTYKAPTEIKYTPLSQNLNYWGTQAEQKLTGNQFAQRNDQVAINLVSQGKTQDTDIEAFLKSQPGYTTATPEQQANTIRAVKERIGAFSQQPQAESDPFVESLKRDLGLINLKGEGDISEFIRTAYGNQQTIDKGREKFSNRDETQRKVQGVIDAVARNKMMESQKGMTPTAQLTESDIQAAMQATGATREEIIAISAGKGYEGLQWDETYKKENLTKDFDRWVDDSTLEKQRAMDDMTTKLNELRQSVSWQIDDIVQKVTENVQGAEKIGALKGFNRSSGYLDGLMRIKDDGNKLIDRLQTQLTQAENADAEIRGRLMEDFNRNLSRAKFDLDQQLTDLKNKTAVDLGSLQSKYSLGSPQMEVAITGLLDNIYSQNQLAVAQYIKNRDDATTAKNNELDLIEKQESQWLNKIKQVETAITAGGGQVLMNMNINDIKGYVSQGMSADVARQMRDAMVNRTIASFSGLSNEDKQTVAGLIDKGSSPTEVMAFLQAQGKQMITTGDEFQNVYVDGKQQTFTKINGQRQPINIPTVVQTQQGGTSYTPIDETTLQNGINQLFSSNELTNKSAQCGEGVNDWLQSIGVTSENMFKDPIDVKKTNMNSQQAKVGSVIVFDPTGTERGNQQKERYGFVAGHVGIVTAVDENGNPTRMADWNRNVDKKYQESEIPAGMKKSIAGYFDPTKQQTQQAGGEMKDTYIELLKRGGLTKSDTLEIANIAKKEGWLSEYNDSLKQGMKTELTPTQTKQWETIADDIEKNTEYKKANEVKGQTDTVLALMSDDINRDGFNDVSLINAFQRIVDPGATVREGDVALLQSSLNLAQQLKVKFDKVIGKGQKLTPENRKAMLDATVSIYNARAKYGNDIINKRYKPRAENAGLDWDTMGYQLEEIKKPTLNDKGISTTTDGGTGKGRIFN